MAKTFPRYDCGNGVRWAQQVDGVFRPLVGHILTTADLIGAVKGGTLTIDPDLPEVDADRCHVLSPVTRNQQFVAQATNYASHVREIGGDPEKITANVFFGKAPSSLCGARDPIRKPARVKLLDYEIELGLIIGKAITGPVEVTPDTLFDWVGGLTICNDVSARDIQIPEGQFYKGKSFRSFSPTGPFLVVPEPGEERKLLDLELTLWVNDQRRQHATVADMIFKPAETLTELSEVMDLFPGDLLITGTPGGVALQPPGAVMQGIAALIPPHVRFPMFVKGQAKRSDYLKTGDIVRATIRHPDGSMMLGEQVNRVEAA